MNQHRTLSWTVLLLAAYSSSTIAGGLAGGQLHALGQHTGSAQPSWPTEPASNAGAINDTLAHPQIQAALIGQDMNAYKNTLNGLFEDKSVWENSFARILRVIRAHPIDTAKKTSALAQYLLAKLEALSPHNQNDKALAAALAITLNSEPNQRFMGQKDIHELYTALCNLAGRAPLKVDSEATAHPQSSKLQPDENKENIENGAKSEKEVAAEQERKKIEDEQALKIAHANNAHQAMIQNFNEKSKAHDFAATPPEVTPEMQYAAAAARKQLEEKLEADRKVREEKARKIEAEKQAELEKASAEAKAANQREAEKAKAAVEEAGKKNASSAREIFKQREQAAKEALLATQKAPSAKRTARTDLATSNGNETQTTVPHAKPIATAGGKLRVGRLSIGGAEIAAAPGQDASQEPVTKQPVVISESIRKRHVFVKIDALKVGNVQAPAESRKKTVPAVAESPDDGKPARPKPGKLTDNSKNVIAKMLAKRQKAANPQRPTVAAAESDDKTARPKPGKLQDQSESALAKMLADRQKAGNSQGPVKSAKKPATAPAQPQPKQNKSKLNFALPPRLPVPGGINMQTTAPTPVATIPPAPAAPRLPVRPPVPYAPRLPEVDNAAGSMPDEGYYSNRSAYMSEKLTEQIIADAKKWGIVKKIGKYAAIGSAATGTAFGLTWLMKYLRAKWAAQQLASAGSTLPQPDLATPLTSQEEIASDGLETPTHDNHTKNLFSLDENTNVSTSSAAA